MLKLADTPTGIFPWIFLPVFSASDRVVCEPYPRPLSGGRHIPMILVFTVIEKCMTPLKYVIMESQHGRDTSKHKDQHV